MIIKYTTPQGDNFAIESTDNCHMGAFAYYIDGERDMLPSFADTLKEAVEGCRSESRYMQRYPHGDTFTDYDGSTAYIVTDDMQAMGFYNE